ncbi:hypothetical protein WJX77_000042 [Trebouxia sp. C0004]
MAHNSLLFNSNKLKREQQNYGGANTHSKKPCTSCGTISTPQWREGPCGPRTLCNACGVKHLRHVRGHQRPDSNLAAQKQLEKGAISRMSKPQVCHVKPEASFKHQLHKVNSVRKNKTRLSSLWQNNTDDCSQPSSESADEVWAASQAAACDQQQDLAQMGTECAAAVNLLSMTRPQGSLQQYASAAPQHETLPTHSQAIQQQCADAYVSDERPSSTAVETEEEHTHRCAAVRHELHMIKREAAAADAAVAAVAQVLERRQDIARKAHANVKQAERQLKQLTEDT